ncbi:DUF1800 domain-containing protein [Thalassoglobus polymorphus]|uniref:DUF1800 domain-containing protein n=1 Tax=Thalassoglobus polymorphus TaxID=2527994 RepID=A0A517QQH2_9PLAN|nr:DUF1800 domain-containing protein [Thalassoglobus polymorphus]QDT33892.1 hypothetical protein Mal48_31480 [Thalassoglobus polymorphus]
MFKIDPTWAWSTFEPKSSDWTRRRAAHLFRRAGFAAASSQLDEAIEQKPAELVQSLVHQRSETEEYQSEIESLAASILASADVKNLPAWWVYRFLTTSDQLREKTTLFWHGHFATSGEKVTEAKLMYEQNQMLREHALGDFSKMVHEIARDPAMLIYLDSATNRKAHPNENFARELMELFCLGEGQYTENDIRELARCFTGWEIRNNKYRFNRYQHDSGEKTFLGKKGSFGGEEGVEIVLQETSGPYFVIRKLINFFVFDEPQPPHELIAPLARQFEENQHQIGPVIETILSSNLFFSEHAIGKKLRSPVEFSVGFLRALEGSTDLYALTTGFNELGQTPFFPPNVKGWDGGRTWINSSTLLARANLIRSLLNRKETRFAQGSLEDFLLQNDANSPAEIVDFWEELLMAVRLPDNVKQQVAGMIEMGQGNREQRLRDALHLFCTLPEFQLG